MKNVGRNVNPLATAAAILREKTRAQSAFKTALTLAQDDAVLWTRENLVFLPKAEQVAVMRAAGGFTEVVTAFIAARMAGVQSAGSLLYAAGSAMEAVTAADIGDIRNMMVQVANPT